MLTHTFCPRVAAATLRPLVVAVLIVFISAHQAKSQGVDFFLEDAGGPIAWPTEGDVGTSFDSVNILNIFDDGERAGQTPFTLTQTFQVDTTFDLSSIHIVYRNNINSVDQQLQIFPVDDIFSATLPLNPTGFLLNQTFDAPTTDNEDVIAQLVLDSTISIPARSTGTQGYALRFIGNDIGSDDGGRFRWGRTDGGFGDVFAGGQAFERLSPISGGQRDFGVVLSDAAPPRPLVNSFSVQSGDANSGATWDTGMAPEQGIVYNVSTGDTVDINSTSFDGSGVVVLSGGTLNLNRSFADLTSLDIQPGATLDTSAITGSLGLGNLPAGQVLRLNVDEDISLDPSSGRDVFLDAQITGSADINVQSNGANSDLFILDAERHDGVIRFNGSGGEVQIVEQKGFNVLEMNSTGTNRLFYNPQTRTIGEAVIFNQPGEVVHAAVSSSNNRLQNVDRFEANADVLVDLSAVATADSLRWRIDEVLTGTGNINVVGTSSAPVLEGVEPNEFEVGFSGEPDVLPVNDYSGTLSANDFVNLEIHNSLPNARVVINNNASVETGHRVIMAAHQIAFGEVEVASGGTLVVGFAEDDRHNAHTLRVTSSGSRDGDLTASAGSTIVMQVNGTGDGEFDRIIAEGDVTLAGQLDVLVDPIATSGTDGENAIYAPVLGDTFDLISIGPASPDGDFTGDGIVSGADFLLWQNQFGSAGPGADGSGDGTVDGTDLNQWITNYSTEGQVTGTITGSLSLNVVDPGGVLAAAGLDFRLNQSATLLQLEVVAAVGTFAVPEPSSLTICLAALMTLQGFKRSSRRL